MNKSPHTGLITFFDWCLNRSELELNNGVEVVAAIYVRTFNNQYGNNHILEEGRGANVGSLNSVGLFNLI